MRGTIALSQRVAPVGTAAHFGSADCMGAQNWDEFPTVMERFPTFWVYLRQAPRRLFLSRARR